MDSRGSITVEVAIVLIFIVLITGVLLTSMDYTTQKIMTQTEKQNLEGLAVETADNLINNPGSPDNWYEHGYGTPGLAVVNEHGETIPNSVSYAKLIALGKDYKKMVTEKIFNSKVESSMELIPERSSISSVKIGEESDANTIISVNRLVRCDFYKKYVLKDFQNEGKCNRKHSQDSHSCNYFKVFKGNLRSSDYYLLIDSAEASDLKYFIDTTRVVKEKYWQSVTDDRIYVNDEVNFYDDSSAVVFMHFDKVKTKAVLVSVPKNFDRSKLTYDYFRTNDCQFILKAWY